MNVTFMQDGSQPAVDAGPGKPKLYHLGTLSLDPPRHLV